MKALATALFGIAAGAGLAWEKSRIPRSSTPRCFLGRIAATAAVALCNACTMFTPIPLYPGPPLRDEQIAIVHRTEYAASSTHISIDGQNIDPRPGGFAVLPGNHEVTVSLYGCESFAVGTLLQGTQCLSSASPRTMTFRAEAGKKYLVAWNIDARLAAVMTGKPVPIAGMQPTLGRPGLKRSTVM